MRAWLVVVALAGACAPAKPMPKPEVCRCTEAVAPCPTLDKCALVHGLDAVKPAVLACNRDHKAEGSATVSMVILPDGTLQSAAVQGALAGTPLGTCVEAAVKTARFPRTTAAARSLGYPFALR